MVVPVVGVVSVTVRAARVVGCVVPRPQTPLGQCRSHQPAVYQNLRPAARRRGLGPATLELAAGAGLGNWYRPASLSTERG